VGISSITRTSGTGAPGTTDTYTITFTNATTTTFTVYNGANGLNGTGSGDVTGPAGGVVDSQVVLFDGVTGKLIKTSGVSWSALLAATEPAIPTSVVTSFWSGIKTWRDLATDIRAAVLTGYAVGANAALAATDSILAAFGKIQGQINARAPIASPAFTGTATFQGVRESITPASAGATYTVANTAASISNLTLTANTAFTFPAAATGGQFTLLLLQDATGSRIPTWPTSVRWPAGTAPTLTTTAGRTDVISFISDGTYWLGFVGGLNYNRT
jgi:hypothetical protein